MSMPLRVVTNRPSAEKAQADRAPAARAGLGERIRRLQAEAKGLARDHVEALVGSLAQAQAIAEEIAKGGEAYPPGVRDLARRLAEDNASRAATLEAIMARAPA